MNLFFTIVFAILTAQAINAVLVWLWFFEPWKKWFKSSNPKPQATYKDTTDA